MQVRSYGGLKGWKGMENAPEDVGCLRQLDGPFGLAAVAFSVVAGHFGLLALVIELVVLWIV